jgi:maleate cis-trans isomerase
LAERKNTGRDNLRPLEGEIGKPVVTRCQAYIWHALEVAHVKEKIGGYGRLMGTLGE